MTALNVLPDPENVLSNPVPPTAPRTARVALVNMPFAMADRPSIQCGLLKAQLARAGHEVDVHYLNLELAAELGSFYWELARRRQDLLLGDWLFSVAAFGRRLDATDYREISASLDATCRDLGVEFDDLLEMRDRVLPEWVERCADATDWADYDLVGFTSTFTQNTAAFALARVLKERHPDLVTVFGGANFDGDMGKEFARKLSFIDYAVIGEGDMALPKLVAQVAQGKSALGLPGVVGKNGKGLVDGGPCQRVHDLDALPDPDYDEYFATLFRLGRRKVLGGGAPLLLFESARGCWWGEKQHCTFCGVNNNGMHFRSKSAGEAAGQLRRLADRYRIVNFEAVDNIMDHRYLQNLCEPLSEEHYDYRLFYEVKSNLKPSQLKALRRAGVKVIQPGIESLNSHLLQLMRKGVTTLRNVRLLKWAHYYDLDVRWNLLTGFPGEREEDYEEQLQLLPLLRHLEPPTGVGPLWLERFSPYFFDRSYPVEDIQPMDVYRCVYPEDELDLDQIAYFFKYRMPTTLPNTFHRPLHQAVAEWKEAWQERPRPELVYQRAPDWIQVIDRRTDQPAVHAFAGPAADIYELCGETERTVRWLVAERQRQEAPVKEDWLRDVLHDFCELGLMLEENGRFLSLALPVNPHW